ncbi:glutamine ABC transporter ATP-binding protein [Halomonas heilongjiangensis]|uniref:Glutamine ABC transporter ATP-binding protein n=2 Tax=Halomonas heilongjiangensis TaxID=1387883 RepID=A0A2N7TGA0_9GAMM|nr:glutamine ABC transporter ATP-binding protein [Halomonas heilongjiangensis]PXX88032.1 glutamine ABC transporter ATP-binding protein [Halomonas heilongjiangensis]
MVDNINKQQEEETAKYQGAEDNSPLIEFKGVTKRFGDTCVMDEMDLKMKAGDRLVIIGPSGSGKSTLLRVLMGLEKIDKGEIFFGSNPYITVDRKGRTRTDMSVRSKIGMVFQHYTLFPHLSVMSNLTLSPVKVRGMARSEAEDRAREYLARLGMEDKLYSYPGKLSGGQKQRVAIARALMLEPKLMLFDEVTSALDPEMVAEIEKVMLDLAKQKMAMMIVTHDMYFAKKIATESVFIAGGKVIEKCDPEIMFNEPKQERTRDFLDKVLHLK